MIFAYQSTGMSTFSLRLFSFGLSVDLEKSSSLYKSKENVADIKM